MQIAKEKKKIAIVIGQLSHGGAENQVVLLAKGLIASDEFIPIVFCLSDAVQPNGNALDKLDVEWYSVLGRNRSSFHKLRWLIGRVKQLDCALLYGFLHIGNIYAGITATLLRLPLVCSIRSANTNLPFQLRVLSSRSCQRARAVIANSESSLQSLRKDLNVKHSRVLVIPNAVEEQPELFASNRLRGDWQIPENALVIGTVALLKKEKRSDFFIKVARQLPEELGGKPLHFVWIGEGSEREKVEKWLASTSAGWQKRMHFPGARSDVMACLSKFNAFVITSEYEGMPNALLEAMAMGLPCVATDVVGSRDVLAATADREEIGILASPSDPHKFAATLLELLHDPARMKKMGETAQRYVQRYYSLEKMVQAHCAVFDDALAGR